MYLYGASGHSKVVIDILKDNKISIDGLFDDNTAISHLLDYQVFDAKYGIKSPLIICIGNNKVRKKIAQSLNVEFAKVIHSSAVISEKARIAEGTVIMQNAVVQSCAVIGKHCIINTGAIVEHDCVVEDFVHISPNAALCGNVSVGEGSWVGAGAVVIQGIKIGKWAVVVKDVPDNVLVYGNPCNIRKYLPPNNLLIISDLQIFSCVFSLTSTINKKKAA